MFYLWIMLGVLIGVFLASLGHAAKMGDAQNDQAYIKHLERKLAEAEGWEAA